MKNYQNRASGRLQHGPPGFEAFQEGEGEGCNYGEVLQQAFTAAIGVCEWDDADGGELIGALMQLPEAVKMLLLQGEAEVDMERVVAAIMRCHANKDAEVVHN